jgi:hypothetical protein
MSLADNLSGATVPINTYYFNFISGFFRNVDDTCALLGYYAASCRNCLPTFWDNVTVPSSRVKSQRRKERRKPVTQILYGKVRAGC